MRDAARSNKSQNQARWVGVFPEKSSTTVSAFFNSAPTGSPSAFVTRDEQLTKPGISTISPGNSRGQQLVLDQQHHVFLLRQRGLADGHLAAHEDQLGGGVHLLSLLSVKPNLNVFQ